MVAKTTVEPVVNTTVFSNAVASSALGKPQNNKFETVPTKTQITSIANKNLTTPDKISYNKTTVAKAETVKVKPEKPVKVAKVEEPKPVKVKPEKSVKVAKVEEPKPVKVKPEKSVKVAKVEEPKPIKVKPEKSVKVAKVEEPKPIKVKPEKPVKVAKVEEPKPVKVKPEKPVKVVKTEPVKQVPTQTIISQKEEIKPFKSVKVESQQMSKIVQTQTEQEKSVAFQPVKVEKKELANIVPAVQKQEFVQNEDENIKQIVQINQSRVNEPSMYVPVSDTEGYYKVHVPQETPVYSAFEAMQNRMPLTRKPFDSEG